MPDRHKNWKKFLPEIHFPLPSTTTEMGASIQLQQREFSGL
jgi:hypothetical protein